MVIKMDVVLPKQLENLQPWTLELPQQRYNWLSNEDIARVLICFQRHSDWLTDSRVHRPENGKLLMFNRKKVQYRKDMYIWKMRRKRKFPREDHVKLKVNGVPCIAATYVHSDVLPSFHRRCYWLIQNPDIILVHYLNYPYSENSDQLAKDLTLNRNSQQWCDLTKEDLLQQILPMFTNMPWPKVTDLPLSKEMAEVVSNHLVEKHFEERVQERCAFVDRPRAIQPKTNGVTESNISVPFLNGTKLLQQRVGDQGVTTAQLNGNTVIIFNQSSSKCAVPPALAANTSQSSISILRENAASTPPSTTVALPLHVSGSQSTSLHPGHVRTDTLHSTPHQYSLHTSPQAQPALSPINYTTSQTSSFSSESSHIPSGYTNNRFIDTSQGFMNLHKQEKPNLVESYSIPASHNYDVTHTVYGVKDVMVTKCDDELKDAHLHSSSEFNLDEFDIDSLFKPLSSIDIPPDTQTSSSAQSAVDDLFPEQLLASGMREADSLLNLTEQGNGLSGPPPHTLDGAQCWQSNKLETIADYSPDWAYTEGGVKVLVTGSWADQGRFMCSFNDVCVPATVVQTGVLRCFCPPHSVGHVDLTVTRDGAIISHPVTFEYKLIPSPFGDITSQWLTLNESSFKMSILERLGRMEERLNSMGSSTQNNTGTYSLHYGLQDLHLDMRNHTTLDTSQSSSEFETKLIELCRHVHATFDHLPSISHIQTESHSDGMTLSHYAAALGYFNLLRVMHELSGTPNCFVTNECNPRMQDQLGCTPLMWASAVGHVGCVELLYEWEATALHVHDVFGRSPLGVAQLRGKMQVYNRLSELMEASRLDVDDGASSLGESTISSVGETIDSGEDTMETDDNFSVVEANISNSIPTPTARHEGAENLSVSDEILTELDLAESLFDGEQAANQCVAALAEQIIVALPGDCGGNIRENDGSGLTLRSLPSYVNSRCGADGYATAQECSAMRRDYPTPIYHINWMQFLQLPPRQSDARYHGDTGFDSLRLTEHERRQLSMAARIVVNACRRESVPINPEVIRASLLIQGCYRKYERFALSKKMNEAAVLIQSKFRSYQEQKRFQRSRHAAILIQSFYRSYKYTRGGQPSSKQTVKLIEDALRGHMTKKRQHQAARKIQRFLRQCQLRSRIMKDPRVPTVPTRVPIRD